MEGCMRAHEFLTEAIMNIDQDVDMIYNEYIKPDIDAIHSGEWSGRLASHSTYTDELTSDLCKRAHELNPCTIYINRPGHSNAYDPLKQLITISVDRSAANLVYEYGSIGAALSLVSKYNPRPGIAEQFENEFRPAKIKGSIHHELVHWIDDSLNNKHITRQITRKTAAGASSLLRKPGDNVNAYEFERQSQIHNIYQLKQHYKDQWDSLTFAEMIQLSGPLTRIFDEMTPQQQKEWSKKIKIRMNREGLLGRNMR